MEDAREALFKSRRIYDLEGTGPLFVRAVKDNVLHHRENCPFYASLLKKDGFDPECIRTAEDCARLPVIPAAFFKYHEVTSVPQKDIEVHATSSGTQGQKSQMFFDEDTIRTGIRMVTRVMRHHGLISPIPANYIMLGYEPSEGKEMGAVKTAMGVTRFAPAKERAFALKSASGGYEVDRFGLLNALKRFRRQGFPVRFVGFPAYFYFLLEALREEGIRYRLNKRSKVLLGGGWKQFGERMIEKEALYAMAEDILGILPENIRDFYSAVEHSVAYAECRNHHLHVPVYSRVFIRDAGTLEPLGFGEPGILSFVTPLVTSAPLSSVMMGDIAVMYDGRSCGCGIDSPYFEVLGRAGAGKMRNCAVAASEYMEGGRA
jgi:phenylacetate-coenzyme A ligase PaaK-like adenylate-forming protein